MEAGRTPVPRPHDRRVMGGPVIAHGRPAEPHMASHEPQTMHQAGTPHPGAKTQKSFKAPLFAGIAIVVVALLGAAGWFGWSAMRGANSTAIDSSKYQAVFFSNGQVYFGKLRPFNKESMKLTEIYYLQTQTSQEADSKNPQQTTSDAGSNVQLIKLGDEIHGPEDTMIVLKNQLLFYENLKPDGKVARSIENYKKQGN